MEKPDQIAAQTIGTVSLICCFILSLAYIRNPSFRKPPGNLAMWQFIYQTIYSLHWLSVFPSIYSFLEGPACTWFGILTYYGLVVSWNYLFCTQLEICIAIKSMKPYNPKRMLFWHLYSHGAGLGFTIFDSYWTLKHDLSNNSSPINICFLYSTFSSFWTCVLMMLSGPMVIVLLVYSWYLRGVKGLSKQLRQFEILTIAALISVFPVCLGYMIKTAFHLPWPDYYEFVSSTQIFILVLAAWGIFNFFGRVYSWSLFKQVMKAAFGVRKGVDFDQSTQSLRDQQRSGLSLYPVIQSINSVVSFIQNIENMLQILSQLFKAQGLQMKMAKKNYQHKKWKFILENQSEIEVIELFWQNFQNLRALDRVTNQQLISSIQDPINFARIEQSAKNPGGRGFGFMFFTSDKRFILKTINNSEIIKLEKMIQEYQNKVAHFESLISRIYGAYQINNKNMNYYVVIFENIFYSVPQAVKFDLKGSQHSRQVSKYFYETVEQIPSSLVYKDMDFYNNIQSIQLNQQEKAFIQKILESDAFLFSQLNIMDYSLIVGISRLEDENIDWRTSKYRVRGSIRGVEYAVYLAIIDYFQGYNLSKKVERLWKSIKHEKTELSVQPPGVYRDRFIEKSKIWFS